MADAKASTSICAYDAAHIYVRGEDLCGDLVGKTSLTEFLCLLILGHRPTEAQARIVEAAIVTMAEHGMTPSSIAARLTLMGAPESLQGAVAAGLLGVGDQFVGTVEKIAPLLVEMVDQQGDMAVTADGIVARFRSVKMPIPGFGQPHHKPDDPRSPALFAIAQHVGVEGRYIQAIKLLGEAVDKAAGRHFTINAPGAVAAVFLEIGLPVRIMRGFVIISRCIGLVAHLGEEQINPAGRALWDAASHAVACPPSGPNRPSS